MRWPFLPRRTLTKAALLQLIYYLVRCNVLQNNEHEHYNENNISNARSATRRRPTLLAEFSFLFKDIELYPKEDKVYVALGVLMHHVAPPSCELLA